MFTFHMTEWIEWQLKDYYAMLPLLQQQQPIREPDKRVAHQRLAGWMMPILRR